MGYILLFLLGLAIGGIFVWFMLKVKTQQMKGQIKAEAVRQAKTEIEAERETLIERLQGREIQLQEIRNTLREKEAQITGLQASNLNLRSRQAELETRLQEEQKLAQEKLRLLEGAEQKLLDAFKALSSDALRNNNQSFLALAQTALEKFNEQARGDLDKRQQVITDLVKPVKDTLATFESKVQKLEVDRVGAYAS